MGRLRNGTGDAQLWGRNGSLVSDPSNFAAGNPLGLHSQVMQDISHFMSFVPAAKDEVRWPLLSTTVLFSLHLRDACMTILLRQGGDLQRHSPLFVGGFRLLNYSDNKHMRNLILVLKLKPIGSQRLDESPTTDSFKSANLLATLRVLPHLWWHIITLR